MKKTIAALAVGLTAALVVLVVDALGRVVTPVSALDPLTAVEMKTYDWRLSHTARPETARQDIVLVRISEDSIRRLQPFAGRFPWPRLVHAELIDYLARAPATVIAYDIDFADPDTRTGFKYGDQIISGEQSDQILGRAITSAGNVVALADATFEGDVDAAPLPDAGFALTGDGIFERRVMFPPIAEVAAGAAALGHNLFVPDPDGPMRHIVPFVRSKGHAVPSFGIAAALRVAGIAPADVQLEGSSLRLGDRVFPLTERTVATPAGNERSLWGLVNFRGSALLADLAHQRRTYPTYDFYDLFYSQEQLLAGDPPEIDPSVFKDKIVFVGTTAAGLFDVFETPFSNGKMPGINIHAAVADDVLSNRFLRPASRAARIGSVVAAGVIVGAVATMLPAWWATAATALLVTGFAWLAADRFSHGLWINMVQPVLTASVTLLAGVGYQYFVEGREKRKMKRLFGQYVSKDVYEQLVSHPELAHLGGTRREMSVLFSDIRGFTTITEHGQPEEIVGMLNEYFTRMVDIVFTHHGTLDKFVGDMVMALFGAPVADPHHAEHAVQAALDMTDELKRLNAKWETQGRFANLDIGIGINSGSMIAGNIGSEQIMSYTVIGDAVNLASRLESLNKQYGTRIIISDATRQHLTGTYTFRSLGGVIVKGKSQPVDIYEVVSRAATAPDAPGGVTSTDVNKEAV